MFPGNDAEYEPRNIQNFQVAADAVAEEGTAEMQKLLAEAVRTGKLPALHVVQAAVESVGEGVRSAYVTHMATSQSLHNQGEVPAAQVDQVVDDDDTRHRSSDAPSDA